MRRISLGILVLILLTFGALGQDRTAEADAAKRKAERRAKLIEALQADVVELKLPENRAYVLAKLGAALVKNERERAANLFRNAIGALLEAQAIAESQKTPNHQYYDLLNSGSVRPLILIAIGQADAEYALESLYRTRPINVQRALAQAGSKRKINDNTSNYPQLAQQEANLEQRLMKMAAEQRPERSMAIMKESIKKHLSVETYEMIKKVWEKEPAAGNELANELVDRLIEKPFAEPNYRANYELVNLSNSILTDYLRERSPEDRYIAFDEGKLRSLATKLIAAYIDRGGAIGYIPLQQLEPITKRFSPSSFAQLKKAAENTRGFYPHGVVSQDNSDYTKLMNSNPTAEMMVSEAGKFPIDTRRSMYLGAANKFSDAGQYERALALLNEHFEGDALENAISSLNWYRSHHLMNRGEFDAAEAMMMEFNESNRISGLISLATTVFNRNREENASRAMGILQRTRSFLPERPETSSEFSQLFQLIVAMANIDHNEAFRSLESIVGQINELADASAVVNRFQGGSFREGEGMIISGINLGVQIDSSLMRTLAEKDTPRALALIDGLSRREMRIVLLVNLLEGGF